MVNSNYVEEYFVDSTYKTNRRVGAEVFGIIANVNGVGFLLAYMLYSKTPGASADAEENAKAITLREWFTRMREFGFWPKFFFTGKDAATMLAINVVFGAQCLRLCLWHMLRSIDKKLSSKKLPRPSYTEQDARAASVALSGENDVFEVSESFLPRNVSRTGIYNDTYDG